MFKKEYLTKIGGFPPINVGDEFYLMHRAINGGGAFGYLPGCQVKAYVQTGEGGLSSGDGKIKGENALYEEWNFKKDGASLISRLLFEEATDINFDWAGEIAGSGMTLDKACKNVLFHMGCSVCDAFRFASTNPARALGLWDRGYIAKGNVADLIIVNHLFDIKKVIFKGEKI